MFFYHKKKKYDSIKNPFEIHEQKDLHKKANLGPVVRGQEELVDFYDTKNVKSEFLGKSIEDKRISYFFIILCFGLFILLGKSFHLQIVNGAEYRFEAESNRIKVDLIKTTRGLIYDRNGILLVKNISMFTVSVVPSELPLNKIKYDVFLLDLSKIIEVPVEELHEILDPITRSSLYYYQPIIIKDNLSYNNAILLSIKSANLKGVSISTQTRREYLYDKYKSLSHILGYVGKINENELEKDIENHYLLTDYVGKIGIEKFYEHDLRGEHGKIKLEVDAYGVEKNIVERQDKKIGSNVVLNINMDIQSKLEDLLLENKNENNHTRAAAVALDPRNGEVLALVSIPSFKSNDFAQGITSELYTELLHDPDKPLFFRAIGGEYPSGSTFKMIMASAALQEGIITEFTSFLSSGGIRISKWFFPDWKAGGHGMTSVKKALSNSVNTFFYIIGGGYGDKEGLGLEKMVKYSKFFGLGDKLGIDLTGEAQGFVPTQKWKNEVLNEPWYIGDTYHFSIGQGYLLVTPLQVAAYTAAIANGGIIYKPHVVKEVINENTNEIHEIKPEILRSDFIDSENIDIVARGLRQGVTKGSARRLANLPISVAGKTGTAQWSTTKEPHAWFTSFAPYEDPKIVVTILVEQAGEGSEIAVPIAQKFYEWWGKQ